MKSGKAIDISKSSLISLKAELSRKKEEVQEAKERDSYIKLPPKPKPVVKSNAGVEDRMRQDLQLQPEEIDLLKKSREVLEVKSKLYDELQKGKLVSEDGKDRYLVDFAHKEKPSSPEPCHGGDSADDDVDETEIDESEWVEYTDCLGRTRKCHRSELDEMKEIDEKMALELSRKKGGEEGGERPPELVSADMEREQFRQKWEEQERELLNKKDIHYQDILFDEARAHGVGYFKFSRDEGERRREQELLRKVREETVRKQKEVEERRQKREAAKQARLIAARQRQRARMGLEPISIQEILKDIKPGKAKEEVEEKEDLSVAGPSTADHLEVALKKAAHVRPWDIGKDNLSQPVMSQEEWIEKQRGERKGEFAPMYSDAAVDLDPSRPPPEIRRRKMAAGEHPTSSSEDAIEAGLRFIREQVEKEHRS